MFRKLFNPLLTLIAIQVAWIAVVAFWIYWYLSRHRELSRLAKIYPAELLRGASHDWVLMVEGLVLLAGILVGVWVIFIFWRRQSYLYQQQRDFMHQVTHELKSPLASIRLHLETIRLRGPKTLTPEKMERFVETMLSDTERLDNLISNLLTAARFEYRNRRGVHPPVDLSALVEEFMEGRRETMPTGGALTLNIQRRIEISGEAADIRTMLRNLYENALLYGGAAADITVTLRKQGKKAILEFADRGRGIDRRDLRRIFQMFYRVRHHGENIKGTGLGLYIVRSIAEAHGGTVRAQSAGIGKGTTFVITLPLREGS